VDELIRLSAELIEACTAQGLKIATAESCTGGLIATVLTEIPGASAVVDRGFVTYSDAAKTDMLGVASELIQKHGAVSEEVALAMAEGALARSAADMAVAVTGIAGPSGGTAEKPVGLVYFALLRRQRPPHQVARTFGDRGRSEIRLSAARQALTMLREEASL
jgi:nicotinamide-nucleotide amidase